MSFFARRERKRFRFISVILSFFVQISVFRSKNRQFSLNRIFCAKHISPKLRDKKTLESRFSPGKNSISPQNWCNNQKKYRILKDPPPRPVEKSEGTGLSSGRWTFDRTLCARWDAGYSIECSIVRTALDRKKGARPGAE